MRIRWLTAFLDFPSDQFGAEVTFWRAIAGSTVSPPRGEHREFASLEPFNGDPHLRVQRIHEGPGGVHLDLHVDDPKSAVDESMRLGANIIRDNSTAGWMSLTSPAGFVFCLVAWRGESERSRPIRWPGDTISIIDQVCIDVPHDAFDREVEFWSAITGRPTTPTSRPELVQLSRDPALAVGILLQRIGRDDPSTSASGHLDLAATAVEDEVTRHEGWGAEIVERFEYWTVMRDPMGRRYCITSRNPRTGQ